MSTGQGRILALQRQVTIARRALERIKDGHRGGRDAETIAGDALDEMWRHEPTQPLQGLVGHERRKP